MGQRAGTKASYDGTLVLATGGPGAALISDRAQCRLEVIDANRIQRRGRWRGG